MACSIRPSSPPAASAIRDLWRIATSITQQLISVFCAALNLTTLLILLVVYAVAHRQFDLFLIATFFLACTALFRPCPSPCAASDANSTAGPVPKSPSNVDLFSNSSTNVGGDLKSVTGVVASNLAAPRKDSQLHHNLPPYNWNNDPDNLQSKDAKRYYRFIIQHAKPSSRSAHRKQYPTSYFPSSTTFTPPKVACSAPSPCKPKQSAKLQDEALLSEDRPSKGTFGSRGPAPSTHFSTGKRRPAPSTPSTERPSGSAAQRRQDEFFLRRPDMLQRMVDENVRRRVEENQLQEDLSHAQCNFEFLSIQSRSTFVKHQYRHGNAATPAFRRQPIPTPMDIDAAGTAATDQPMDQDEPRQTGFAFGQPSSPFTTQPSPPSTQNSQSRPWSQSPPTFTFVQPSLSAPASGRFGSVFSSIAQPSDSAWPRTPAHSSPPTTAFARSHTQEQQQHASQQRAQTEHERLLQQQQQQAQRDGQKARKEQEAQDRSALREQQRQDTLARLAAETERLRLHQEAECAAAEAKFAEERRKKEESAKERARISAKIRARSHSQGASSQPSSSTQVPLGGTIPVTPKPKKKVAFADENAPPPRPASVPPQTQASSSTQQPVASSSTGYAGLNPAEATEAFLADIVPTLFEPSASQFLEADEGEETEVDDFAQAKHVKQKQGEHDEPEGFDDLWEIVKKS